MAAENLKPEESYINEEPYYEPIKGECQVFDDVTKLPLMVSDIYRKLTT